MKPQVVVSQKKDEELDIFGMDEQTEVTQDTGNNTQAQNIAQNDVSELDIFAGSPAKPKVQAENPQNLNRRNTNDNFMDMDILGGGTDNTNNNNMNCMSGNLLGGSLNQNGIMGNNAVL